MNDQQFTRWMKEMARAGGDPALPDANAIWWRAQLQQRLVLEERAMRPLRLVEGFACAMCLIGAVVLSAVVTWGKL